MEANLAPDEPENMVNNETARQTRKHTGGFFGSLLVEVSLVFEARAGSGGLLCTASSS
jgi:hypothetical protein